MRCKVDFGRCQVNAFTLSSERWPINQGSMSSHERVNFFERPTSSPCAVHDDKCSLGFLLGRNKACNAKEKYNRYAGGNGFHWIVLLILSNITKKIKAVFIFTTEARRHGGKCKTLLPFFVPPSLRG